MSEVEINDAINEATVVKKKPGRPKKKVNITPIAVHGIVDKPSNPEDVIELMYGKPALFKKISQLLKKFDVDELELQFNRDGMRINAVDHTKKSNIFIFVNGKHMNLYYCNKPISIVVNRMNAEKVLDTLDKNISSINIILKENYRSTLYIVTKGIEYNNSETYEFNICCKTEATPVVNLDDTNYPLKFKFSSKYFKRKITEIQNISDTLVIEKIGADPLELSCNESVLKWFGTGYDERLIDLKNTLDVNEILRVSICVSYIRPFANAVTGDEVYIAIDKTQKASFTTFVDPVDNEWVCTIKVFTTIENFRENLE